MGAPGHGGEGGTMRAIAAAALAAALLVAAGAEAATVKGIAFPDTATIAGRECPLNGVGVRSKFFVTVYLGALYLATPTADAAAAIGADEPKRVVMHFVHSRVGADKLREGWAEGFRANAGADLPALAERLGRFSSWFDADLLEGEEVVLTYEPGRGTAVAVRGVERGVVAGADFMRALWSVWLGAKPADAGLRKGMLGGG
jgi:hypothetical protein